MYITDGHDDVFALDAATGEQKWSYKPIEMPGEMPSLDQISVCCGRNNRGVIFVPGSGSGTDKVIYGRLDDVVVALDAKTGEVLWKNTVADFHTWGAILMASQAGKALVILALSGVEYQVRGRLIALHTESSTVAWRFYTTAPRSRSGNCS